MQLIVMVKVLKHWSMVANLNTAVIYRGILTIENVSLVVNYRDIFIGLALGVRSKLKTMAVKKCLKKISKFLTQKNFQFWIRTLTLIYRILKFYYFKI